MDDKCTRPRSHPVTSLQTSVDGIEAHPIRGLLPTVLDSHTDTVYDLQR